MGKTKFTAWYDPENDLLAFEKLNFQEDVLPVLKTITDKQPTAEDKQKIFDNIIMISAMSGKPISDENTIRDAVYAWIKPKECVDC